MNEDDIQQIFLVECEESLEAAESGLDACAAGTHDDETINAIFRAVHSIKGGAGAFGHTAMQAYTHCFENLLGDIREGSVALEPDLVKLLLLALDCLRDHVDAVRDGGEAPDDQDLMTKLEAARKGSAKSDSETIDQKAAQTPVEPTNETTDAAGTLDDLDALLDELSGPDPDSSKSGDGQSEEHWLVNIRPRAGAMANGSEPLLWLRELAEMGGECVSCLTSELPPLDALQIEQGYLGWVFQMPKSVTQDEVAEIFDFVGEDCAVTYGEHAGMPDVQPANDPLPETAKEEAAPEAKRATDQVKPPEPEAPTEPAPDPKAAAKPAPAPTASQSVRIDLSKLDTLIDGVGELVIAQAMLAQRLDNEGFAHIEELAMLDTLVRDIQEHAMAFRAQPIRSVFSRVPRLLRELSSKTGKHIKLEVSGETTELDKTVIERLGEPMTHLIRNAVDHGIEPSEERQAAGKDPEGTLTLSAEQKAGRIVINIQDDGRGINCEKIRAKAISKGLISEDAQLSEEEIQHLVFAPGFSTAVEVSNISGRGVGMDVVRQNVKDLGGRVTISSVEGVGTTFTLALPLTLAISDGMIVQVGDQSLVVPLTHVIESVRPRKEDLKGMGTDRQILNVRGQFVPIVALGQHTGARNCISNPSEGVLVIVETEGFGQAALLVDEISDQRQFVIKSLDTNFRTVESVAGATILGNGQVALIVDVDFLVQNASRPSTALVAA